MRTLSTCSLALAVILGVAVPACLAAPPQVVLNDPDLSLFEMRPLDRHVFVLTLEGDWKTPPDWDASYYVNIQYPNGVVVEHRPTLERMFRKGEVQCLLIEYQWEKNGFQPGDRLSVFITRRRAGSPTDAQEVISNRLEVAWPFDRKVGRRPPKTRFTEPDPIDIFRPEGDEPVKPPKPAPVPVPVPVPVPPPADK
jgi:hypothetical protein